MWMGGARPRETRSRTRIAQSPLPLVPKTFASVGVICPGCLPPQPPDGYEVGGISVEESGSPHGLL